MSKEYAPNPDIYWAAEADSSTAVAGTIERIRRYRESLRASGRAGRMRRNWNAYQGWGPRGDADASRLQAGGESGEMLNITVNHFAAMVNQAVVLTTSNKPAVTAIPSNSDFESLAEGQLAESLNDHYDRELAISDREYEATMSMVLLSEAWIVEDWDATAGADYMPAESGQMQKQGDIRLYSLTPFDVSVDPDVQDCESYTWMAWRRRANRFDLAAQYPKCATKLRAANLANSDGAFDGVDEAGGGMEFRSKRNTRADSDCVYVWELRHLKTPALPNGRRILFVTAECVLADSVEKDADTGVVSDFGYPFGKELYAYTAAPERMPGLPDGHTSFFDLLSLQEGIDLSASIMASAINSGGLQNLYVPRGANVTATKLTGALNIIEYDGATLPKAQDNLSINPAVVAWAEMCVGWMRQRVSLNDVVMGEPSKGMPAQAMALLRAQAVEFHSRLQAAYERLVQRTRTGILKLLKQYATTERVALVSGKANSWALKYFKSENLKGVDRFIVEPVNPVLKTLAGKVGFAQPLLDSGQINMQEYLQLVSTGRMEPILRFAQDNQARIQKEKEMLMQGIGMPPVQLLPDGTPVLLPDGSPIFIDDGQPHIRPLITDTHWVDIPEYLGVLAMPEVRDNPMVVKAVTEIVDYKLRLWRQMDIGIIMLLKGVPPPPPPMMGGLMPGSPPPEGPVGDGGPPKPPSPALAGPPGSPGASMPKPPKNPITGEQDMPAPPGLA